MSTIENNMYDYNNCFFQKIIIDYYRGLHHNDMLGRYLY